MNAITIIEQLEVSVQFLYGQPCLIFQEMMEV